MIQRNIQDYELDYVVCSIKRKISGGTTVQYSFILNENKISVETEMLEKNFQATIASKNYDVDYSAISPHHIQMIVNGKNVNAYIFASEDGKTVVINGQHYWIQDADWLEQQETTSSGIQKSVNIVTPPMPAIVISVNVESGAIVKKGQAVVVVSAMKMETTLVAPFDGQVKAVNVKNGDKVMPGDVLVDIEQTKQNK